jgi:hypothetical protein
MSAIRIYRQLTKPSTLLRCQFKWTQAPMQTKRFRVLLPLLQCPLAALFGGVGLWQRASILNRRFIGDQTFWDSTAAFHVWPWAFKFAVVENLPAFLAGVLLSWPIGALKPGLPESVELAPSLLFALVLWYWVGLRLDRRPDVHEKTVWGSLTLFTCVSLAGAFVPIGSSGYLPFAALLWLILGFAFRRLSKTSVRT